MTVESYTNKAGARRFRPIYEEREMMLGEAPGFCIGCGMEADGVEPDARRYVCEACGEPLVYGAEELLLNGIAKIREVAS